MTTTTHDNLEHRLLVEHTARTLSVAKQTGVDLAGTAELLDRLMPGVPGMSQSGGLAVQRSGGVEDPDQVTETTVYVVVGGYGEYGTFHLANGLTSDPYGGRVRLRCHVAGHPQLDDTCACGQVDYREGDPDDDGE